MGAFIEFLGLGNALLAVHLFVLGITAWIWSRKPVIKSRFSTVLDVLGFVSILVTLAIFLIFLFDTEPNASTGNAASWFLIFSVVSLGIIPAITLLSFFLTGRLIGKRLYKRRMVRQAGNLGRPQVRD